VMPELEPPKVRVSLLSEGEIKFFNASDFVRLASQFFFYEKLLF
jgi:hypothetical protein